MMETIDRFDIGDEHDLVDVNRGVEPDLLLFFELDLFFVDSDAIRSSRQLLIAILGVVVVPVVHTCQVRSTLNHSSTSAHSDRETAPAWSLHTSQIS